MKKLCIILFIYIVTTTTHSKCYAQNCPNIYYEPIPLMFVDKNTANERILEFSNVPSSKYEALRKVNGYQDLFLIFSRKAVDDLLLKINIDLGIRIYFARYTETEDSPLPKETEDGIRTEPN